jgi:hypothetical protein
MAFFAVIVDNKVENILIADDLAGAELATEKTCVEYDPVAVGNLPHIGLGYDGTTFEQPTKDFVEPVLDPELLVITPGEEPIIE